MNPVALPAEVSSIHLPAPAGCSFRTVLLPADEPFLCGLYASIRLAELAHSGWPPAEMEAFLRQQYYAQQSHYFTHYPDASYDLLLQGDRPIGRVYVHRAADQINLMEISLLSDVRGQGMGTFLLRALQAEVGPEQRLVLHVENYNPALRLYMRHGFKQVEETPFYLMMEWRPAGG